MKMRKQVDSGQPVKTLADHAEAWWSKSGNQVPSRTRYREWEKMYEQWIDFAFEARRFIKKLKGHELSPSPKREDQAKVGIHKNFKLVIIGFQDEPLYFSTLPEMKDRARCAMRAGRAVRLYVWGRVASQSRPNWIETKAPSRRNLFKRKVDVVLEGLLKDMNR